VEKGESGLAAMRHLYAQFDPAGLMNPGKLVL
jgi:FAD/FMN-containing dehydrogenase